MNKSITIRAGGMITAIIFTLFTILGISDIIKGDYWASVLSLLIAALSGHSFYLGVREEGFDYAERVFSYKSTDIEPDVL